MKYGPIQFTDRAGRTVELRNAEERDAEDLLTYLKATAGETPYLLREPDEITMTAEEERAFLHGKTESADEIMLIATVNGEHVGNCSLMRVGSCRRTAHRCSMAIALYRKYQGFGIGRKMMETLLEIAGRIGYEQAELEVVDGNETARTLYESLGFACFGRLPDNMKYSDGSYRDTVWMAKKLP